MHELMFQAGVKGMSVHALLGHAFVNSLFPKIIIELARHEYH